jgi:hypothetical protein
MLQRQVKALAALYRRWFIEFQSDAARVEKIESGEYYQR